MAQGVFRQVIRQELEKEHKKYPGYHKGHESQEHNDNGPNRECGQAGGNQDYPEEGKRSINGECDNNENSRIGLSRDPKAENGAGYAKQRGNDIKRDVEKNSQNHGPG